MWRSVAAKASSFRRASHLLRTTYPKVSSSSLSSSQSLYRIPVSQNPRVLLLSQPYAYSTESWKIDESAATSSTDLFPDADVADSDPSASATDILGEEESQSFHSDVQGFDDQSLSKEAAGDGPVGKEEPRESDSGEDKLQSVTSLLQTATDGSLESALNALDLQLDETFVMNVLKTELIHGDNLLAFFNWARKTPEFTLTSCVTEALVRSISVQMRKNDAYAVWDIVKEIGDNDAAFVNVEILNQLIALFSKLGKGKAAYEVYSKFEEFGFAPNEDTYFLTIEALCRRSFYKWSLSIVEKMMGSGLVPDKQRLGNVISWLCKGKMSKEAHSVYLFVKQNKKHPPTAPMNFLISSLSRKDETVKLALEMLDDLSGEARKYGIKPFTSVIRGLCRTKEVEEAKFLLNSMIESGPPPSNGVFNFVIDALSKLGKMDEAKAILKLMKSRGLKPDVYTYTVIMSGYTKNGQMEEALKILSEAKTKHAKLSHATYHTLIRGYCKLEEYDKAVELVHEMKDYGVEANADEYNKLIRTLCLNAVDWKTAETLLDEMNEKGLHLYGMTKGLVNAVRDLEAASLGTEETEETEEHAVAA